jgi:hypothetical protein
MSGLTISGHAKRYGQPVATMNQTAPC